MVSYIGIEILNLLAESGFVDLDSIENDARYWKPFYGWRAHTTEQITMGIANLLCENKKTEISSFKNLRTHICNTLFNLKKKGYVKRKKVFINSDKEHAWRWCYIYCISDWVGNLYHKYGEDFKNMKRIQLQRQADRLKRMGYLK